MEDNTEKRTSNRPIYLQVTLNYDMRMLFRNDFEIIIIHFQVITKFDLKLQIFAALVIGGLSGISVGAVLGFSAILLPKLGPEVTLTEKSWIGTS